MMRKYALLVWFGIFLTWSLYRLYTAFPDWIDEAIFKPLVFVVPVVAMVSFSQKKPFAYLGLAPPLKDAVLDLYLGVVFGIVFAFEALFVNFLKHGEFSFHPILSVQLANGIVPFLFLNLMTSVSEETLARGYLYKTLLGGSKRQVNAAIISSFLFLLLHIPIALTQLQLSGAALILYPFSILILGFVNCYLFSLRKSLMLPILIHLFWNMTVALYL